MWFKKLTNFTEETPHQVRQNLLLDGNKITSTINGKSYIWGSLEIPTLKDLRQQVAKSNAKKGQLSIREVVANVQDLHTDEANAGAFFQVASQFNLLEMVSPRYTPEDGIDIYEHDRTQGPVCAIAAGAGTIYRNYFVEVNGKIGQTEDNQIDCLKGIGNLLGNDEGKLWAMQNGYALASSEGLTIIAQKLRAMNETELDELRQALKIGIQWDTQVTVNECEHLVSQAFCSALPVAYSRYDDARWAEFAELVLEASYEATFAATLLNFERTGNNKVFLTLIGGGAFGNRFEWIFKALKRALNLYSVYALDVVVVSYGRSSSEVRALIEEWGN